MLSVFLFVMLALGTDGVPTVVQTRRPLPLAEGLPKLPAALGGYKYLILKLGPVQLTRKGVAVATAASCLSFTVSTTYMSWGWCIYCYITGNRKLHLQILTLTDAFLLLCHV